MDPADAKGNESIANQLWWENGMLVSLQVKAFAYTYKAQLNLTILIG